MDSKPLTIRQTPGDDCTRVVLSGVIDEFADFSRIDLSGSGAVEIDFEGVRRCNSSGVLRWSRFLKTVPDSRDVRLVNCPSILVRQFNVFPAFLGHPRLAVESFFVAMHCPGCEVDARQLLKSGELVAVAGGGVEAPAKACDGCGGAMELDGSPESVFLFLKRQVSKAS